jgi:hypothetical protein
MKYVFGLEDLLWKEDEKVSMEDNLRLSRGFEEEEIEEAFFQMEEK